MYYYSPNLNLLIQQMRDVVMMTISNIIYNKVVTYLDGSKLDSQSTTQSQHKMQHRSTGHFVVCCRFLIIPVNKHNSQCKHRN